MRNYVVVGELQVIRWLTVSVAQVAWRPLPQGGMPPAPLVRIGRTGGGMRWVLSAFSYLR